MTKQCIRTAFTGLAMLMWSVNGFTQTDSCQSFFTEHMQPSFAKIDDLGPAGAFAQISSQAIPSGCILGDKDTTDIAPLYKALYPDADGNLLPGPERSVKRKALFDLVIQDLDSLQSGECVEGMGWLMPACVIERQKEAILALKAVLDNESDFTNLRITKKNQWLPDPDSNLDNIRTNLTEFVEVQCGTDLKKGSCEKGVIYVAKLLRSSNAMYQAIVAHQLPIINENALFLSTRDQEWSQYFNTISVQYPWELGFNSWVFTREKTDEELALFPQAPNSKFIILHPSVGYEYIDTPASSGSFEGVVLLELAGYERWRWENGKAKSRWGGSVVLSFADIQGMDTIGIGVTLHTPFKNSSVGLIWRDGDDGSETSIFMNVDLAKLIMKYKDANVKKFLTK